VLSGAAAGAVSQIVVVVDGAADVRLAWRLDTS